MSEVIFVLASIIISIIALLIAHKSDKQMNAITNLHYEEKLAMMASYLDEVMALNIPLKKIKHDLSAISALRKYANVEKKEELIKQYIIPILKRVIYNTEINLSEPEEFVIAEIIDIALKYKIATEELKSFKESLRYPHIKK